VGMVNLRMPECAGAPYIVRPAHPWHLDPVVEFRAVVTSVSAWTHRLCLVLVAASSIACSVIVEPVLLPCATSFSVGNMLGPDFYERVDFNQGSVSFWVAPVKDISELSGEHVLVDVGGLVIGVDVDSEAVFVRVDGTELVREEGLLEGRAWGAEQPHFFVVRWDLVHPVTANGEHVSVRVDGELVARGMDYPQGPASPETIVIGGSAAGEATPFVVERVLVMRRPMPRSMEVALASGSDDRNLALPSGSWDVLFASYSEGPPSTCGDLVEAWSHPISRSLLDTTASLLIDGSGWSDVGSAAIAADDPNAIFAGYGRAVDMGSTIQSETLAVGGIGAVTVAALVHPGPGGEPYLLITDRDGNWLTDTEDGSFATREEPFVLVATVEIPKGVDEINDIRIEVGNLSSVSSSVYVHWVDVQENLLAQPSFEVEDDVVVGALRWDVPEGARLVASSSVQDSYSGDKFAGASNPEPTSPHVFTQAPDLDDYRIYVAGGFFLQERIDSEFGRPGVSVSNGTLFSLYSPFESELKIGTRVGNDLVDQWQHLSVVGKRLLDSNFNAHFDNVHFGNAQQRTQSDFWLDNTYVLELDDVD